MVTTKETEMTSLELPVSERNGSGQTA